MRRLSVSSFHCLLITLTLALSLPGRGKKKSLSQNAKIRAEHYYL